MALPAPELWKADPLSREPRTDALTKELSALCNSAAVSSRSESCGVWAEMVHFVHVGRSVVQRGVREVRRCRPWRMLLCVRHRGGPRSALPGPRLRRVDRGRRAMGWRRRRPERGPEPRASPRRPPDRGLDPTRQPRVHSLDFYVGRAARNSTGTVPGLAGENRGLPPRRVGLKPGRPSTPSK